MAAVHAVAAAIEGRGGKAADLRQCLLLRQRQQRRSKGMGGKAAAPPAAAGTCLHRHRGLQGGCGAGGLRGSCSGGRGAGWGGCGVSCAALMGLL